MARLVCKLAQRLRRGGYLARSLRLSVRDDHKGSFSEEIGLPCVHDTSTLLKQYYVVWRHRKPGTFPIQRVEVTVAGLVSAIQIPRTLFEEFEMPRRLSQALDQINERWGPLTIYFESIHDYRQLMENKIAFGRIPSWPFSVARRMAFRLSYGSDATGSPS